MASIDIICGIAAHIGIGQSNLRIIVVNQVSLGEGFFAKHVAGLGHVDDQRFGFAAHELFDMVLVGINLALIHLGSESPAGHVGLGQCGFSEGFERGRILVGNRQVGLAIRSGLVGEREGNRIILGKLPIRRRNREGKRSLVAAGREIRGSGRGAGDESGLVGNGNGHRRCRSGLDTENINADGFRRMVDVDRSRLIRREIVLGTACLGTGLIRGLLRAGEKYRRGEERQENVC